MDAFPTDEFRSKHGLHEEFDRSVRTFFRNELVESYRCSFETHISGKNFDWTDVGRAIGVDRGTAWRWYTKATRPDFEKILLFLGSQDMNIYEIHFPTSRIAVTTALASTLAYVASRLPGTVPPKVLAVEMEFLQYAYGRVPSTGFSDPSHQILIVLEEFMLGNFDAYNVLSKQNKFDPDYLKKLLFDWFIPWVLTCDALQLDWIKTRGLSRGRD